MTMQTASTTIFDQLRKRRPDGEEFWSARDLLPALGYQRWENAQSAITRATEACENSGQAADTHFRATTKKVKLGSKAARDVLDYHLTRYGAYLTAMNSDPAKGEVALAQTYFAVQTRTAELAQGGALGDDNDPVLRQLAALAQVRREQITLERRVNAHELELSAVRLELDQSPVLGPDLRTVYDLGQRLGQLMGNYQRAWRLFKDRFQLASYRDLPRCQLDDAVHFLRVQIAAWQGAPLLEDDR